MKSILQVLRKEWMCFIGSDRGVFGLYAILVLSEFSAWIRDDSGIRLGALWLVLFSVVVSANFSRTVFISERITGALEILITSGLSRSSILFGKMLFVIMMSLIIGGICLLLGLLWPRFLFNSSGGSVNAADFLIYAASVFLNVSTVLISLSEYQTPDCFILQIFSSGGDRIVYGSELGFSSFTVILILVLLVMCLLYSARRESMVSGYCSR